MVTLTPFPRVTSEEEIKQELEKVSNWKGGNVRGISLKTDSLRAIELKVGKGAVEKIQNKLIELGYNLDSTKFESYSWYPACYGPMIYLVSAHLFSWGATDVEDLGKISTRGSMLIKIIMNFISMGATLRGAPGVWSKYYDFGELVPLEYSEKNLFVRFEIKGYNVHPINEFFHTGYFRGIVELVTGSKKVTVEVPKSIYRGDESSEYKISW